MEKSTMKSRLQLFMSSRIFCKTLSCTVISYLHTSSATHSYCRPYLRDQETHPRELMTDSKCSTWPLVYWLKIPSFFIPILSMSWVGESLQMTPTTYAVTKGWVQSKAVESHATNFIQHSRRYSSTVLEVYLHSFLICFTLVSYARCFLLIFSSF